jgi:hypothetical protein
MAAKKNYRIIYNVIQPRYDVSEDKFQYLMPSQLIEPHYLQ